MKFDFFLLLKKIYIMIKFNLRSCYNMMLRINQLMRQIVWE